MTHREQSLTLLVSLHDLVRAGRATDLTNLAARAGLAPNEARAALARLEAVGLVLLRSAAPAQLTLRGLALASALAGERESRALAAA